MDKIRSFLISYWWILGLLLITLLSYGQTLNMYFWVDDWGMAYKMQHLDADIPNFGPGIFGNGAYRYNVTPFIALYPLFGLNAFPYFLIGFVFYFLASLVVYLLAKEISGRKVVGILSAIIFSSGYIGSDAMNHLNNSYQLVSTGAFSALASLFVIKHYKTGFKKYYLLSLLIYVCVLEFLILRSHGIFLLILFTSLLSVVLYKKSLVETFIKLIPFFAIWLFMFFIDPRMSKQYDGVGRGDFMPNFINLIFKERHFELFNNFLVTFSSVIFPDEVLFTIYRWLASLINSKHILLAIPLILPFLILCLLCFLLKRQLKVLVGSTAALTILYSFIIWSSLNMSAVWNPDLSQLFISSWFGGFLILLVSLYFLQIFKDKLYIVYFGMIWVTSNVITYFIYTPTTTLSSITRYLIPAFMGTCIVLGGIFNLFSKKYIIFIIIPLLIYCGLLISLANERAQFIVENISIPARNDLRVIKNTVSKIDNKTYFYIETANGSKARTSDLGGIPYLSIPVILDYHGFANIAVSYDELFYLLEKDKTSIDNIYTFFGKNDSIVSTTQEFKKLLSDPGEEKSIQVLQSGGVGVNVFEAEVDYPSLVLVELTLRMKVEPTGNTNSLLPANTKPLKLINISELERYLISEKERRNFYAESSVKSNSNEKTREAEFMFDQKNFTSWEASSKDWRNGKRPVEIGFTLNEEKIISNFIWINYDPKDTPTDYALFVSNDRSSWSVVKQVQGGVKDSGEIIVDSFSPIKAKYFKMSINDTYGGRTSAPGIVEAWIGQTIPLTDQDKLKLLQVCIICNLEESNSSHIESLYKDVAKARVWWETDKFDVYNPEFYQDFYLNMDGNIHEYKIYIPAQGTRMQKIKLGGFVYPVNVLIESASLRSINLEEMKLKNLIHNFSQ